MSEQDRRSYEFGPFRLIPAEQLLLREGRPVALAPKDFEVLVALVRRSGRLVEKAELLKEVWPEEFVEEANLSRHVYALRRALDEDEAGRGYIETVPKRGYRFTAAAREVIDGGAAEVAVETLTRTRIVAEEEIIRGPRVGRRVLYAALAAGLLFAAAAFLFTRYRRPAAALTERDTVLLADFENRTGDPVFDGTLKQALAVQLEQSPFLSIFSDERVRETLRYMGRSPDERVTKAVAREVCQRQGVKALLSGSIASLGSHYVITLEALNAQTGDPIAREQTEAEGKEQVLRSLGRAATDLRERLGESLGLIQKFDAPIEEATTSSLEALKAYSLAVEQGRTGKYLEAASFYKRAIELDPNFALAYSGLAAMYRNTGQAQMGMAELAAESSRKAFELRDRVSEREKLSISYRYHFDVTFDMEKAAEVLELWRRTYPRDYRPLNSLALVNMACGRYEKVVEDANESLRLNPNSAPTYVNLGFALLRLNRFDEAKAAFEQALERKYDAPYYHRGLFWVAFFQEDRAAMQRQIEWHAGKPSEYEGLWLQAQMAALSGRLDEAREFTRRAVEMARHRNLKEVAAEEAAASAVREAYFGNCRQASERVAEALAIARARSSRISSAEALALCGQAGQAQALLDELTKQYPNDTFLNATDLPLTLAAVELHRDNAARAVELLEPAREYEMGVWAHSQPTYLRGLAYLRLRAGAEAAAEFQKMLDHKGLTAASPTHSYLYALAHLGLARAAALAGDTARSRKAYEDFFALWKEADPDIPLLQQARREYGRL